MSPGKMVFPEKMVFGGVKTVIGVPGKVVYLYCAIASLPCSLPFVSVETYSDGYLVGKELVILLFGCKCFVMFYAFSFPPGVFVGTQNLFASISGPSLLTLVHGKMASELSSLDKGVLFIHILGNRFTICF